MFSLHTGGGAVMGWGSNQLPIKYINMYNQGICTFPLYMYVDVL